MAKGHVIGNAQLRAAMQELVRGFGSEAREVELVVDNLVEANLTGHDSHGVGMLPRYTDSFLEGGLVPNAHVKAVLDAGAMLRLDGQAGFGQVVGHEAMLMGIERAKKHGTCIMALGNAHHLCRIGAWAEMAIEAGLISVHFTNVISRGSVAPHGGSDARFGTNPFTVGIPVKGREPILLDFATSVVAQGKARVAHNKGEKFPPGRLIDNHGNPTEDPKFAVVPPIGAILPFGEHKGSGLAVVCELLGGALAAGRAWHDTDASKRRVHNGMLTVIIDPNAIADQATFERETLAVIDWVRASPPRQGFDKVRLAGDPERETKARRLAEGIPIDETTWKELLGAAGKLKLDPASIGKLAGV